MSQEAPNLGRRELKALSVESGRQEDCCEERRGSPWCDVSSESGLKEKGNYLTQSWTN